MRIILNQIVILTPRWLNIEAKVILARKHAYLTTIMAKLEKQNNLLIWSRHPEQNFP